MSVCKASANTPSLPKRFLLAGAIAVLLGGVAFADEGDATLSSLDRPLQRIALGSCAKQFLGQPIWSAIAARRPDVFVHLGDVVYASRPGDSLRDAYRRQARIPEFRAFRRQTPMVATWDDHDFGMRDGHAAHEGKHEAERLFLDFFDTPEDAPVRARAGVYQAFMLGPPGRRVQVILLDTRYFRAPLTSRGEYKGYVPNDDPEASMLGPAQWGWLEGELQRPAQLRLLCSSVQVLHDDHLFEHWGNLPGEQRRLFDLLSRLKPDGLLLLSGDRHYSEISRLDGVLPYPLYEVTASGLTHAADKARDEPNRRRVGPGYYERNFGLLDIDWDARALTARIHDVDGRPTETGLKLAFDDLTAK